MQCLAGGGHSCYYNRHVDNYEKIKKINESLRFTEKNLIFARYISGVGKSNDDFALGLIFQG